MGKVRFSLYYAHGIPGLSAPGESLASLAIIELYFHQGAQKVTVEISISSSIKELY